MPVFATLPAAATTHTAGIRWICLGWHALASVQIGNEHLVIQMSQIEWISRPAKVDLVSAAAEVG